MLRIDQFSSTYFEEYADLYKETWRREPYGESFTSECIASHLDVNVGFLYLLIHHEHNTERVIGFVGGRPLLHECGFFVNEACPPVNMKSTFYVDELGVHKEYWQNGLGEFLMLFIMGCARLKGFDEFVLRTHASPNNPAIKLYSKLDYETRRTLQGEFHGVDTSQARIDDRDEVDRRIYYYKSL